MLDLPIVRRKSGDQPYDKNKIMKSLMKETGLDAENSFKISVDVTRFIYSNDLKIITGPLIREITNVCLLKKGYEKARLQYTRIGFPFADIKEIFQMRDWEKFKRRIIAHIDQEYRAVKKLIGECDAK